MINKEKILETLKEVYDPEIPVNIVDLGLIYNLEIQDSKVKIQMTLTAPGCPLANVLANTVKEKVMGLEGITDAEVELTWNPPWDLSRLTEEGKNTLHSYGFNI